jgi:hypothetical protein
LQNPESLTPLELLERYFVSKNTPRGRVDALLALAGKLIEQADARASE